MAEQDLGWALSGCGGDECGCTLGGVGALGGVHWGYSGGVVCALEGTEGGMHALGVHWWWVYMHWVYTEGVHRGCGGGCLL